MRNPGVYFEYLESGKKCSEASVPTWGGGGVGVGGLMPSQCIPGYGARQRDTFHCPLTRARLSRERGCWAGASLARTWQVTGPFPTSCLNTSKDKNLDSACFTFGALKS